MAKKKTKIVSNRGFATTSTPSKQPEPVKKPEAPPKIIEKKQDSPSIATPPPKKEEADPVLKLMEKYKSLNEHKSQLALDRLTREDENLPQERIKTFRLGADIENDLLKIIKNKQSDLFGENSNTLERGQDTEKMIGQFDIIYRTLLKLGFEVQDVSASFEALLSTSIEDHLDWLCVNVPYERIPVGFFDKYFNDSDDEDQITLTNNQNNKPVDKPAVTSEPRVEPMLVVKETRADKQEDHSDMKSRILQAAQQYMNDEEEEDINEKYAKAKIELSQLEKLFPSNNDNKKKNKKKQLQEETPVTLNEQELAKLRKDIMKLKDKLSSLEADWDYDKKIAEELYNKHLQVIADEKRQQQLEARQQLKKEKEEQAVEPSNNNEEEDDDEGGLFGGMMMDEEQEMESMSQSQTTSSTEWKLIQLDVPKSYTGRYPKDFLLDYCNKHKFGKQSFNTTNMGAGIWRSTVKIVKNARNLEYISFELPADVGTFNRQDAEQLVSMFALFELDPGSSVYKTMSNSYKDLWTNWLEEKKLREEAPHLKADKKRFSFLKDLVEKSSSSSKTKRGSCDFESMDAVSSDKAVTRSRATVLKQQKLFEKMQQKFAARLETDSYKDMKAKRNDLPITAYRGDILDIVKNNQFLIISGETGCGKSTQVPQFLAEDLLLNCKEGGSVICTQPRRISAMSIANRVSTEMGDKPKSTGSREAMVGYQIRLESKSSAENVLLFCTTGILLRRLESDKYLDGVTHVIVDEVHERTIESDFLLVVLRKLCAIRTDLKIILMSATVEASRFSSYFGNCPVISVPGRTYPVHVQFLEDVVEDTGYTLEEDSPYAVRRLKVKKEQGDIHVSGQHGSSQRVHYEIFEEDTDDEDPYDPTYNYSKLTVSSGVEPEDQDDQEDTSRKYSRHTRKMIKRMDDKKINYDLILELLDHICNSKNKDDKVPDTGAILIFLPGMNEIRKLFDLVSSHNAFGDPTKYLLIALHSTLSSEHQEKAFEIPPEGVRKIVLSTNIAETGVTISDVTVVIDTGMARVVSYDDKRRVTRLLQKYVAKANARQRRGRAGRVQEGVCFHLFTQQKFEEMADYETPEILRLPLEELCLRIKICGLGSIRSVLSASLDAPSEKMIDNAILTLQEVQALSTDGDERLTPLGVHLSNLPVDVHIGKMILFGAIFRCLDPILTIAAALSYKSPFVRPFGKEDEADNARARFKVHNSDFLTIYNAYSAWRRHITEAQASNQSTSSVFRKLRAFCKENFLSQQNLEMMEDMKRQYFGLLVSIGFVKVDGEYKSHFYEMKRSRIQLCDVPDAYNIHSGSVPIINAALTAGLYPKIAESLTKSKQLVSKDMELQIHPSSVLFQKELKTYTDFLVYNTVVMNASGNQLKERVFMWEAGWIDAVAVILLATDLEIKHKQRKLVLDKWVHFDCFARTGVLLKFLRKELNNCLAEKMETPDLDLSHYNEDVMSVLVKTLEANST